MSKNRIALLGLDSSELSALAQKLGEPAYRGKQLAEWIYWQGACRFADMTNLPDRLRSKLSAEYEVGRSRTATVRCSADGTLKMLLSLRDGAQVETVGLPYTDRLSCCVSTQVGCPVGCVFCATGMSGYVRNLTAGEIIDQVLTVQEEGQHHWQQMSRPRIDHVIFMGMGEPLLNYDATIKGLRLLNQEMGIAARQLTISTSGLVTGIRRLAQEDLQITLAVSLHAPNDSLRQRLVPGMSKWSVAEIIEACREYVALTGRRVTFEYCLLGGINDGNVEAHELTRLLRGLNCHVNLIPYNPVRGSAFNAASPQRIRAFRDILEKAHIQVTQRVQRGADIDAACGQLRRRVQLAIQPISSPLAGED